MFHGSAPVVMRRTRRARSDAARTRESRITLTSLDAALATKA